MIRIPKYSASLGAVVIAAGALTLLAPRAAHAVAAALVQVTNTTSSPVVTQGIPTMVSQLVDLYNYTPPSPSTSVPFYSLSPNAVYSYGYSVPENQTLVITSADITPYQCPANYTGLTIVGVTLSTAIYARAFWYVSGQNTAHYSYPTSGIAMQGGSAVGFYNNSACSAAVELRGYLTTN